MSQTTCSCAPPDVRTPGLVRPPAFDPGLAAWSYVTRLAAAVDRLAGHWRRRAAIRALHRIGDRDLRDIGIDRGEIDSIVDDLMERRLRARQRR